MMRKGNYLGLVNVCKLPGMSSHSVVSRLRRIADMQRIGHTGTLDPAACGVMLICLGAATRLVDYIDTSVKSYRAEITLGMTTDCGDAEGVIMNRCDASHLTPADITSALLSFTGDIRQTPPAQSAVWINGVRAYNLVRQGIEVEMPERAVTVYDYTLARFTPGVHPRLLVDITCSSGTFIRSLARDLGAALGVGGTLTFLCRTCVGDCLLRDAITTDELDAAAQAGELARYISEPDAALTAIPALTLPESDINYIYGVTLPNDAEPGLYRIYLTGIFRGLGRVENGILKPVVNLRR